jgi:aspartyl-tRNA(Asn)/glutamyl-tRNA(Gln) amidotransferase subunit A
MGVEDAALVLDVMAGKDPLDSTTIAKDPAGYVLPTQALDLTGVTIGVIQEYMTDALSPPIKSEVESAVAKLRAAGAKITQVSLPSLPLGLAVYYVLCPAEVSSNLSRYDGQRYGSFTADAQNLFDSYTRTRETGFGAEAKRRIMVGTYVLSSGYYDAYYKKAQTVRTKIINEFAAVFNKVDYLLGPTAPMTAFKIGENTTDPLQMYLADIMTVSANLAGVPAISIPCGLASGLPVGLQLIAPQHADRKLLQLAQKTEELLS